LNLLHSIEQENCFHESFWDKEKEGASP